METKRGPQQEKGAELAERLAGLAGLFSELSQQYGRETALGVLGKMQEAVATGQPAEGLEKVLEGRISRSEFQAKALKFAERRGMLKRRKDGVVQINRDSILGFEWGGTKAREIASGGEVFVGSRIEFLLNAFAGQKAVDGSGEDEPRDIFYLPSSSEDAFDIEKIRAARFLVGFWEVRNWTKIRSGDIKQIQLPTATDDLKMFEVGLAAVIYHPNFGAGFRDDKGWLMVRQADGSFKPITGDWIHKNYSAIRLEAGNSSLGPAFENVIVALKTLAPNLSRKGLLKESDFILKRSEKKQNPNQLKTSDKGLGRFERVRYNFGYELSGRDLQIEKIGPSLGVVVELGEDGVGKISGTFKIYESGDPHLIERRTSTGKFYDANRAATGFTRFDRNSFTARKDGEDEGAYKERLSRFADLEISLKFNNDLAKASQLSLRSLPPEIFRLRAQSMPGVLRRDYESVKKFVLAEQEDGLEILAVIAHLPETSQRFLALQEKAPKELGKQIMHSVLEIGRSRIAAELVVQKLIEKGKMSGAQGKKTLVFLDRQIEEAVLEIEKAVKQKVKEQDTLVASLRAKGIELPALAEKLMIDAVQDCAQVVSFEVLLGVLKEGSRGGEKTFGQFFERAQRLITPELPDDTIGRLQDLYKAIRFEQYGLNDRMQGVDERILEASATPGDSIVDLGAGTGRLAEPMLSRGFSVTAVENTPRHTDLLRKIKGLRVVGKDWVQTGLPEGSQDVAYCLGRSFLHEFTLERQNAFFEEAARILRPGGTLILDIPDRDKGNYAKLVAKFGETMEDRGMLYRKGTIYDSPDGKNYFTRYVFSLNDIADLARRHGFELVKTQRESLDTGEGDENIYITLRKVNSQAVEVLAAA